MSSYKKGKKKGKPQDRAFLALLLGLTLVLIFAFIYLGHALGFSGQKGSNEAPLPADQAFIQEMVPGSQALQEEYGVLPSIMISQAILESDWGESDLAKQENNYFGRKDSQDGVYYMTKEYKGQWEDQEEPFKVYDSLEESMQDHARLLAYGTSWDSKLYQGVIQAPDYKSAAYALQEAGYATDPNYAQKLIKLIERYQLDQYDHPSSWDDRDWGRK